MDMRAGPLAVDLVANVMFVMLSVYPSAGVTVNWNAVELDRLSELPDTTLAAALYCPLTPE